MLSRHIGHFWRAVFEACVSLGQDVSRGSRDFFGEVEEGGEFCLCSGTSMINRVCVISALFTFVVFGFDAVLAMLFRSPFDLQKMMRCLM